MRATASWRNQGEFKCFIARRAIPGDVALTLGTCSTVSLRSGRLALESLNTLLHPLYAYVCESVTMVLRMLCVPIPFVPVFGCS